MHFVKFRTWTKKPYNLQFLSCFIPRYIRTLTFDIILSTAFGVQSECQTNPDDPTMVQARDALRFGPVALTVIGLGLLLPYGTKLLKLLSPWLFKNFQGIKNVADQVIRTSKEKGEGTEKVSTQNASTKGQRVSEGCFFFFYLKAIVTRPFWQGKALVLVYRSGPTSCNVIIGQT